MRLQTFEVNGLTLQACVAGPASGELVILLHGFPESADAWRAQIPVLARAGLRVIAPHQRGYAGSSKPLGVLPYRLELLAQDVLALADAAGAERFSLVGHDWGAAIAFRIATFQPDRLSRLVVLNGAHPGTVPAHAMRHPTQWLRSWYIGAFQLPFLPEAVLRAGNFAALRQAITGTARPGAIPEDMLDTYAAQWAEPAALGSMLAWYRAIAFSAPVPPVPLELPVTVLWGEQDAMLDRGLADAALALCPQGRLVALARATHWLHHEETELVNEVLLEALA